METKYIKQYIEDMEGDKRADNLTEFGECLLKELKQLLSVCEQKQTEQQSNCNLPQVSNRYEVRDWMGGQLYEFDNYDDAKKKYDEIYEDTHNDECDIQLYNVLHDFSNIEEQK